VNKKNVQERMKIKKNTVRRYDNCDLRTIGTIDCAKSGAFDPSPLAVTKVWNVHIRVLHPCVQHQPGVRSKVLPNQKKNKNKNNVNQDN
jgi:hypothetical protein